jgi:hypothetical protein
LAVSLIYIATGYKTHLAFWYYLWIYAVLLFRYNAIAKWTHKVKVVLGEIEEHYPLLFQWTSEVPESALSWGKSDSNPHI